MNAVKYSGRPILIFLGLVLTGASFAQTPCAALTGRDKYEVNNLFGYASLLTPNSDAAWSTSSSFNQPQVVTACVWSVIDSCKQRGERSFQCGQWKILHMQNLINQMKVVQPPCEFVRDAQNTMRKSHATSLRARLCLASVMQGSDLKCFEEERRTFRNTFQMGDPSRDGYADGGPGSDLWLSNALYLLPAPNYAPLLPWLQSLPVRSKNPHRIWAKKLAIAAHQKDLAGFLALYRETDRDFAGYISKWAIYYFPQTDWKQEFSKMHFTQPTIAVDYCSPTTGRCGPVRKNRQRYLLEYIQDTIKDSMDHPDVLANEIKQREASFCRTNLAAP